MSDEFDRLKRAFKRQNKVSARESARKAALGAAFKQFDQENIVNNFANNSPNNFAAAKGKGFINRLREQGNIVLHAINRRQMMNFAKPHFKQMLAGGVSLAVLAVAIVNIDQIAPNLMAPEPSNLDEKELAEVVVPQASVEIDGLRQDGDTTPKSALETTAQRQDLQKRQKSEIILMDTIAGSADVSAPGEPIMQPPGLQLNQPVPGTGGNMADELTQLRAKSRENKAAGRVYSPKIEQGTIVTNDREIIPPGHYQDQGRDKFTNIIPNPTKRVIENPVSTFSIDVDSASYSFVRSSLNRGVLPQKNAVRVEEMVNYFNYAYSAPQDANTPFATHVTIMPTPWNANTKLMQIGIKGYQLDKSQAPHANLVFLIDTSGSMNAPDKLPLLRNSFKLLLASLKPDDTVAIVTYAGSAGTVLAPTKVADKNKILTALDRLHSGGSTHGADGIYRAYQLAEQQFDGNGVNRVILATDGDFNVGITDPEELKNFVERKRKTGVTLSVLGFGHGNYNDQLMQALAQNGNGNAAYIDTLSEARKVLVDEAGATLFTIAKDVKLQLEFNPATISQYRLIGYETRQLRREDFNNDKIDAGDIGAGHSVTALYEITPVGVSGQLVDTLRYQTKNKSLELESKGSGYSGYNGEYAFMKIRYKLPDKDVSQLITSAVTAEMEVSSIREAPQNARFASAVAAFGQILRGGRNTGFFGYDEVIELALSAKGEDRFGYRAEFINLVRLAKSAAALQSGNR